MPVPVLRTVKNENFELLRRVNRTITYMLDNKHLHESAANYHFNISHYNNALTINKI